MEPIIIVVVAGILYFIPYFNAKSRKHKSAGAIGALNLFLGWTLLGWLVALIWSYTGNTADPEPTASTHVKCPDCAELVKREARVCKHCGCKLIPQ